MSFDEENRWLGMARFRGNENPNPVIIGNIINEIDGRKESWKHIDEKGDFSSDELARLIDTACSIISHLKKNVS